MLAIIIWNSPNFTHCLHANTKLSGKFNTNRPFSGCKDIIKLLLKFKKTHSIENWLTSLKQNCKMTFTISTRVPCHAENQWVVLTHIYTYTVTVKHITFKTSAKFRWCKWNNCMSETFFTIIQTQHYHSSVFLLKFCLSSSFSWEIFLFLEL